MNNHIGIVGIGVMGSNIALNFSDNDTNVSVYNKSEEKINQLISEDSSKNISGFTDLEEFVKSIEKPRKILILVPSGEATNSVVENLFNFIEEKDTLIDGPHVKKLEKQICKLFGKKYALMVNSGSSADKSLFTSI